MWFQASQWYAGNTFIFIMRADLRLSDATVPKVPYVTLSFNTDINYLLCEFMEAVNVRVRVSHLERTRSGRFITDTSD
jgi:hypothetical protein